MRNREKGERCRIEREREREREGGRREMQKIEEGIQIRK
jgi:hypothetical protein